HVEDSSEINHREVVNDPYSPDTACILTIEIIEEKTRITWELEWLQTWNYVEVKARCSRSTFVIPDRVNREFTGTTTHLEDCVLEAGRSNQYDLHILSPGVSQVDPYVGILYRCAR